MPLLTRALFGSERQGGLPWLRHGFRLSGQTGMTSVVQEAARLYFRHRDPRRAFGPASVAVSMVKRPFLSGDNGDWVASQRSRLERQRLRALECVSRVWLAIGVPVLAVEAVTEAVGLESFRVSSYQLLMSARYDREAARSAAGLPPPAAGVGRPGSAACPEPRRSLPSAGWLGPRVWS